MYKVLEKSLIVDDIQTPMEAKMFGYLWKSPAPSRIVAFSWKLLKIRFRLEPIFAI